MLLDGFRVTRVSQLLYGRLLIESSTVRQPVSDGFSLFAVDHHEYLPRRACPAVGSSKPPQIQATAST